MKLRDLDGRTPMSIRLTAGREALAFVIGVRILNAQLEAGGILPLLNALRRNNGKSIAFSFKRIVFRSLESL